MGPKDSRDSTETDGNIHPAGKGKGKAQRSRTPSNASLGDLTPEKVDTATVAVHQIYKIFRLLQECGGEISDVENIYGLSIDQQARIDELETELNDLMFRKDQEMERLRDENDSYKANARQFKHDREALEQDRASIEETHNAIQSNMEKQFSDKLKTKAKQIKEDYEEKIQALKRDQTERDNTIKKLEEKNARAQKDLEQQRTSLEIDKRGLQSHVKLLEAELQQINAASAASPQTPKFYIEGFRQLWEGIRDVAVDECRFLPEDTQPLDNDTVRNQLFSASAIFKFSPLSTESPVATFLRACAIQNFLSTKIISIIRRQYFAETTAGVERSSRTQLMDSILDTISDIPAATSRQELSWRLTTVDKLDRLPSHSPSATMNISTEPSQGNIVEEILDLLHYFQGPTDQPLRTKLTEITRLAVTLWSALRKDSCQINFDYEPSIGDRQEWDYINGMATDSFKATNSLGKLPVAQLPLKSFMLFPRIMGSFGSGDASPHILHAGSALSHDSPVFQEGLREIEHIGDATKEFKRNLRRGSSAQSSPVIDKPQRGWPATHRGFD